jgi:type VI secretion system protein ImpK
MITQFHGTDHRHRLAEICSDCFMLILQLRTASDFGDPEVLRRRIKELFDKMERECKREGIAFEDIEMARFALVAFIDESVLSSEWSQKEAWLANPLQLELFNRYDAGEEFFVRLEQLRQRPQAHAEVLEVYYLSMALGFKGRYQLQEQERLRYLMEDTLSDLRRVTGKSGESLSPHGQRRDEIVEVVAREVPLWVVGVGAAAVGFFFYLIMTFLSSAAARDAVEVINGIT